MELQVSLAGSDFDTVLAVYTGGAVNALTLVATNDNCPGGNDSSSCTTLAVVPGMNYSIQVDGTDGFQGKVAIAVTFVWAAPRNDAFSTAMTTFPATGTTLGATLQTGEPQAVPGMGASGSVWYRFTAPVNGIVQVSICRAQVAPSCQ